MTSPTTNVREPELRERLRQLDALDAEFDALFDGCDDEMLNRPREDGGWSMAQHLDHLIQTWGEYRAPMSGAIETAPSGTGPFRHGWLANRFIRALEPPPRFKAKAPGRFQPVTERRTVPDARAALAGAHREIRELIARADGRHLGQGKLASPVTRLLRLSLGQAFDLVVTHERRHAWHCRRLRERAAGAR